MNQSLLKNNKSTTTSHVSDEQIQDYFFVLCEWYKTNHDLLKFPLLNHLPVCLYTELTHQKNPIVQAVLLCIYNCEAYQRNNSNSSSNNSNNNSNNKSNQFRLLTQLFNNQKSIYNIAEVHHSHSGHSDGNASVHSASSSILLNAPTSTVSTPAAAASATTSPIAATAANMSNGGSSSNDLASQNNYSSPSALTSSALQSFNRNQQVSSLELRGTYFRDCKLPLFNSMNANDSFQTVIRVLLQVFIQYLDVFDVNVLLDMCHVMYRVMSGGMPYIVPSWQYISKLMDKNSTSEVISTEQITLEETKNNGSGSNQAQMYTEIEEQTHMSLVAQRSAIEKLSHMQLLQIVLNNTNIRKNQQPMHQTPRVHLDKGVINEVITIVKYCVCAARHLQDLAATTSKKTHFEMLPSHGSSIESLLYGTLYAVHARVMYEQIPELMLYTRSVLSIL